MAESFTPAAPLGQTTPIERVRDSRRGAIDQEGKRKRPKKPEVPVPTPDNEKELESLGASADNLKSGKIVDIVI